MANTTSERVRVWTEESGDGERRLALVTNDNEIAISATLAARQRGLIVKRFASNASERRYGGIKIVVSAPAEPGTAETVRIPSETLAECADAWVQARAVGAVL
ncbi:MAG: hypothetical protein ACTHU0_18360 [Kofleriaceae bacterium]